MKFTIAIPAFKASYLKECIDSILGQTYTDFELIIVNDNSPEKIDTLIATYKSGSFQYYKNEKNFGAENVVDNWNKCLSYAKGDFFILMGDDDKMSPEYLMEFAGLIEKFPLCDVYHCRTVIINEASEATGLTEPRPEFESVYDSILQRLEAKRVCFISDFVYRTDILKNAGGFYKLPLAWASDDISSFIAAKKNGTAHTNKPVFMYRRNAQNITSSGNVYLKMDAIMAEEKWMNIFLQEEPMNETDALLAKNVRNEIKKSIQKKKIRTIYSSDSYNIFSFFKWLSAKKKYGLTTEELVYALILRLKERRKVQYDN